MTRIISVLKITSYCFDAPAIVAEAFFVLL